MSIFSIGGSTPSEGFELKSVRHNFTDDPRLTRTPSSAGDRKLWTFSCWFKPATVPVSGDEVHLFTADDRGSQNGWYEYVRFVPSTGKVQWQVVGSGGSGKEGKIIPTMVFRDPAAWYHIVCRYDSANATAADRMRIYINGDLVTAFDEQTTPALNYESQYYNNNKLQCFGNAYDFNAQQWNGYMAEAYFIDGSGLAADSFGETNEDTNQWQPKNPTDIKQAVTFGKNGYYLPFSNDALADSFAGNTSHSIHTVTPSSGSNPHTDTTIKKFGTASGQWNNSTYLSAPDSIDWCFGDGDYTLDFWLYHPQHCSTDHFDFIISQPHASGGNQSYIGTRRAGSGNYYMMSNFSGQSSQSNADITITLDEWNHWAICRNNGVIYFYKDGVSVMGVGSGSPAPIAWPDYGVALRIGYQQDGEYYNGYADEIRISKGIARYPGGTTFSVPTSAHTADEYDVLLLHCDGSDSGTTFTDSSWNGAVPFSKIPNNLTAYGNTTNTRISSHSVSANGDAHIIGPKVGSSAISFAEVAALDYLSLADSADWDLYGSAGSSTFEFWVNHKTTSGSQGYIAQYEDGSNRWWLAHEAGSGMQFEVTSGGSGIIDSGWVAAAELTANRWYHVAVVKNGNDYNLYVDGVSKWSVTDSSTDTFSGPLYIGYLDAGSTYPLNGYMDEIRISNVARYTANFTPDTTEFSTDANTKLLIHGDGRMGSNAFQDSSIQETFNPTANISNVEYLIVGGGGSGGAGDAGGGGAGGYRTGTFSQLDNGVAYSVIVGQGGGKTTDPSPATQPGINGNDGGDSSFNEVAAAGGGGGGGGRTDGPVSLWKNINGRTGGSGGGGSGHAASGTGTGAAGNTPSTSPSQGNAGGNGSGGKGGGGGGSSAAGNAGNVSNGTGGAGTSNDITGSAVTYAAGGDGDNDNNTGTDGSNGTGDGGKGTDGGSSTSGAGGHGIVILTYQASSAQATGGQITTHGSGASQYYVHKFFYGAKEITVNGPVMNVAPKIGLGMGVFDGSGDYAQIPDDPSLTLGGPFTVEAWVYFNFLPGSTTASYVFDKWTGSGNQRSWEYYYTHSTTTHLFMISPDGTSSSQNFSTTSGAFALDTWYHIAFARDSSNNFRFFINGTQVGSTATNITSNAFDSTAALDLMAGVDGYMDECRISNGVCRYTSNFTPSTTAFKDDKDTVLLLHMDGGGGIDPTTNLPTLPGQGKYFWDASTNAIFYDAGIPTNKSLISFDGSGDYLSTPGSTDFQFSGQFTIEGWLQGPDIDDTNDIFYIYGGGGGSGNGAAQVFVGTSGGTTPQIDCYFSSDGSAWQNVQRTVDPWVTNRWYHIAIIRDGSNNCMIFIDGEKQGGNTTVTGTIAQPAAYNTVSWGARTDSSSNQFNGYMDQLRLSDTARYTANFTPPTTPFTTDANTKLLVQSDFSEGGLGADHSNNYNYFTPTNLTASDMMEDSPMNNFCTFNSVGRIGSYSSSTPSNTNLTFSEGNLLGTGSGGASSAATFPITSGKWYWEIRTTGSGNANIGIYGSGNQRNSNTFTATAGNIYGIKFDADTGTGFEVSTNGGAYSSSSGLNSVQAPWTPWFQSYSTNCHFNFGQDSSFAGNETAQGNQDSNKKGDFYYTPPSGYLALCTDNLADPSIALPADNFETQLWTGDGTTGSAGTAVRTFTPNFDPGMVWVKGRSVAHLWQQADILRGPNEVLISSGTSAQQNVTTDYGGGGIGTLGTKSWNIVAGTSNAGNYNTNNDTYAGWAWKADTTFDPTSAGTIAVASGKSNAAAGFSIVKYTGENAVKTIGHGLATAPKLIIVKAFEVSHQWECYYMRPDGSDGVLFLDQTGKGEAAGTGYWNDTNPTASVFTVGTGSGTGGLTSDYIAYCFTDIEGYSKVGKYFANSSADGPFIYTGFQPAFVIIKALDYDYEWVLFGDKMNPYNAVNKYLYVNNNNVETVDASGNFDIVSNGFKLRDASYNNNHPSGAGFLYYAVADIPFKTSNAR